MVKIGMTGSRTGITESAKKEFLKLLKKYTISEAHHGDCIGADKMFHDIIREHDKDIKLVIHPPSDKKCRAFCDGDIIEKEKTYLVRNKDIVNSSDIMFAFPPSEIELLRSGTWSTIRYCRIIKKTLLIIYPEGNSYSEN